MNPEAATFGCVPGTSIDLTRVAEDDSRSSTRKVILAFLSTRFGKDYLVQFDVSTWITSPQYTRLHDESVSIENYAIVENRICCSIFAVTFLSGMDCGYNVIHPSYSVLLASSRVGVLSKSQRRSSKLVPASTAGRPLVLDISCIVFTPLPQ